tara:strand:- start:5 stop:403 length:399 start_codon:yes stop_codon:yes gene_type:complete
MALTRLGRLVVVGIVLTLFVVMMSVTIQPVPQYSIDEIMDNTDTHLGERIHIRGTIVNGTLNEDSLVTLVGIEDTMKVDISGLAIPVGFEEGKMVSVKGVLKIVDDIFVIRADEIQTGCPSKYDPSTSESLS